MEKVTYVWKIKLSRPWTFGNNSCRLRVISHLAATNAQLVVFKNCCKTSWIRAQTCLATNQVVAGSRNVEAESRQYFYFLQQNLHKLRVLPAQGKFVLQMERNSRVWRDFAKFHPIRSYYSRNLQQPTQLKRGMFSVSISQLTESRGQQHFVGLSL